MCCDTDDPYPDEFMALKQARQDGCTCLWWDQILRIDPECPLHGVEDD